MCGQINIHVHTQINTINQILNTNECIQMHTHVYKGLYFLWFVNWENANL